MEIEPTWLDRVELQGHFRRHARDLGFQTVAAYEQSSKETVEAGTRFNYRDRRTGDWRIGYYDRVTERFTSVTDDDVEIVTHFRCPERYVVDLLRSDCF